MNKEQRENQNAKRLEGMLNSEIGKTVQDRERLILEQNNMEILGEILSGNISRISISPAVKKSKKKVTAVRIFGIGGNNEVSFRLYSEPPDYAETGYISVNYRSYPKERINTYDLDVTAKNLQKIIRDFISEVI